MGVKDKPKFSRPNSVMKYRQIPRPPLKPQSKQYIRKNMEFVRCHTPDQGGGKPMPNESEQAESDN